MGYQPIILGNRRFTVPAILMMVPFCVMSTWLTIYGLIILFYKLSDICTKKKQKTVCEGEFECEKGCENCAGRIFLKHKDIEV